MVKIRSEIEALIRRGNVTPDELDELRCNSWEWEALVPALADEALIDRTKYAIKNCLLKDERPFSTYNEAVPGLYTPELLKRFSTVLRGATTFAEVIDNVREALGMDATHYLIVADDVKELVEAVEKGGESPAAKVLGEIRDRGKDSRAAREQARCVACDIETEIGTEEKPHPVPRRFHKCVPDGFIEELAKHTEIADAILGPTHYIPKKPSFTYDEVVQILKNVGRSVECGACAAIAFTGVVLPGDVHTCGAS